MKPRSPQPPSTSISTADPAEIAHFDALAADWWDTDGPMAPLHRMNPARLEFILSEIKDIFPNQKNLDILDVGCGGGLACEPLARLGHRLTGIDGASGMIKTARTHAASQGLEIDYRHSLTGDLLIEKKRFDVVLALEVIEHVTDPAQFVSELAQLLKPQGLVIFSTLNRTPQSFAAAIVGAEYLLGWLPKGTHDWHKFIKPSELHRLCVASKLSPRTSAGMVFRPMENDFVLSPDKLGVNYLFSATRS